MPNDYSVEIHKYLSNKIAEAEHAVQLEELRWIRRYLQENIDLKDFVYF